MRKHPKAIVATLLSGRLFLLFFKQFFFSRDAGGIDILQLHDQLLLALCKLARNLHIHFYKQIPICILAQMLDSLSPQPEGECPSACPRECCISPFHPELALPVHIPAPPAQS